MNYQEIFDKALAGVLRQGRRAMKDSSCVYWNSRGERCAVGQILDPDVAEEFENRFSGNGITSIYNSGGGEEYITEIFGEIGEETILLLSKIQSAHDTCEDNMKYFREQMEAIAGEFNLTYSEPEL